MSPTQISFLASHSEAWTAHEQRQFEGKPLGPDITAIPFYGETTGEKTRLRMPVAAMGPSRSADGKSRSRGAAAQVEQTASHRFTRSRSASPPRRRVLFVRDFDDRLEGKMESAQRLSLAETSTRPDTCQQATKSAGFSSPYENPLAHGTAVQQQTEHDNMPAELTSGAALSPAKKKHRPHALSFLDPDSPAVTKESITRVVAEASSWRYGGRGSNPKATTPPSASSSSSLASSIDSDSSIGSDNYLSQVLGGQDSDAATSPETSERGDDADAGSPTPKPTPTSGAELRMPDFTSVALTMSPISTTATTIPLQGYPQTQQHAHTHSHSRTQSQAKAHLAAQQRKYRAYRYGTPEMPRGNANLPHLPPSALNPRVPTAGHVKHLPRAEKLPLTGYELLASQLSSHSSHVMKFRRGSMGAASTMSSRSAKSSGTGSSNGSVGSEAAAGSPQFPIKPLYRKFEALNHRILLHLQDELSELEEQLHRLDTADTQTRRLQNSILPASRRAEVLAGGELQWHKTDILGKIGYKLGQYNHVLSSFTETQHLASPTLSDISDYRTYLDVQQPIAEIETRFLDASEDLITLSSNRKRPSSGMSSPSSSSASEESLSPSYLQTLAEDTIGPVAHSGPLFPHLHNHPPSLTASPMSDSSTSSALSSHSSRATTAIFDKEPDSLAKPLADKPSLMSSGFTAEGSEVAAGPTSTGRAALASDDFLHLVIAMAVAVLVPVLTFGLIPDFIGRMAVVLLVAFTVFGAQVQAGTVRIGHDVAASRKSSRDLLFCAAVYGVVMAVVASVCA